TARPLIFSTALPPPAAAGALGALELLEEQPRRVRKLQLAGDLLRTELEGRGFDIGPSSTQIVPLMVGEPEPAMLACERALEQGVFEQAIRPPTVPARTARLRLAVMASHTKSELRTAAEVLGRAMVAAGVAPKPRPVAPPVVEPEREPERKPEREHTPEEQPVPAGGVFDGEA